MLAQSYEDLEKRLQTQLKELDISNHGAKSNLEPDRFKRNVDSKTADRLSCSCDHTPVVMGEDEVKTQSESED